MHTIESLLYRMVNITFLPDLYGLWSDSEVIKYTSVDENISVTDSERKLSNWIGEAVFVILRNGEFIGVVGCPAIDKGKHEFGLFYQIKRSEWGKGLGSAAAKWMTEYIKRNYGQSVIYADVIKENTASEKILKNLGFEFLFFSEDDFKGSIAKVGHYRLIL